MEKGENSSLNQVSDILPSLQKMFMPLKVGEEYLKTKINMEKLQFGVKMMERFLHMVELY